MNVSLPLISKGEDIQKSQQIEKTKKVFDYFSTRIPKSHIDMITNLVKDERFLFFVKYGTLRRYEGDWEVIYVEIPQIPKKLVVYRLPFARMKSVDKFNLSKKDLPHIPLFEGEENLKYLSLEMNQITKIDQLISLNSLLYLNLYCNKISEIENLQNTLKLKVLLLGKNNIQKIKNLHFLYELEVLDLHSNKITQIENLSQLRKLRILNLANNQITSIGELIWNRNLEELNIRKNLIGVLPNLSNSWTKMRKLNIGKNLISKFEYLKEFTKLKSLSELIIEDNPILLTQKSEEYIKILPINHPNIPKINNPKETKNVMNSQKVSLKKLPIFENKTMNKTVNNTNSSAMQNKTTLMLQIQSAELNEVQSLRITNPIKLCWEEENKKLVQMGYNGYINKRYKELNIKAGHVELDGEKKLLIYGDGLKVLTYEDFQNKIESITFYYFYYDTIVCKQNLELLHNFKKLTSLGFCENNLHSFFQLTKIEDITTLENITISKNEVNDNSLLKYFLIYRIQNLKTFNDENINEEDKAKSKQYFELFDKCICINEKKREKKEKLQVSDCKSTDSFDRDIKDNYKRKFEFFNFFKGKLNLALKEILLEISNIE